MEIRNLRIERGWSQEQLAEFSGLSVRTIQRIERGQPCGLESLKSLAAVFEVNINELKKDSDMTAQIPEISPSSAAEQEARKQVKELKEFYMHLFTYVVTLSFLLIVNLISNPDYLWVKWTAIGWGIGVIMHAMHVFETSSLFSSAWEKREIEKRLNK
ncbi:helix-turn-helix domain-containing protein [Pseudohongiella nitratireducens]|uniref:helix-turn-helix domain-containing protein n=1 Tax=Pseudohongiella nitratireducens TaxID=1768907 RepID=UPI0030EC9451|tara:strand:+ start:8533 stop:9006 length:474 start_codon:yes stop_codon:yes gene_type:complete